MNNMKINNMKNKKIFTILSILIFTSLVTLLPLVSAHCPLCTAGAAAGIGIAKAYGVDDSISGLLIGALIASSGLWVHNMLKKRKINLPLQAFFLVVIMFLLFAVPFYYKGVIINFEMVRSMPESHSMLGMGIYGIDKLLFGMIVGTILLAAVFGISDHIKLKRGKRLFAFQGLVFMILALAVFSLIFWLLTKNPAV